MDNARHIKQIKCKMTFLNMLCYSYVGLLIRYFRSATLEKDLSKFKFIFESRGIINGKA